MISICMIKLCGISICKPLEIIFENCLRSGKLPSEWKKANVVPAYKKGDKQCIKNYCQVSLLLDCSKVFVWLLYNNMFSENNLISPKQSGFRPGDSLLSIAYKILSAFDDAHEGVSFTIYLKHLIEFGMKACFSVTTKQDIRRADYSNKNFLGVELDGQHSPWADVKAGIPQGSIFGPLLFLIYINDLPNGLNSNVKLFADDTVAAGLEKLTFTN